MTPLVVRCPAKVNLHLEVLGSRPDGYHEVRTLLAAVGLFDELEVEPAPPGVWELHVEGGASLPRENTVARAAQLLRRAFACEKGARVVLRKRIPMAAGLGGGSADGAGALVALARLWGLEAEATSLMQLAAELGSDVPFFVLGGACWAEGRGEVVYPLPDLPRYWVVLIPGKEPVPTPAVYRAWDQAQGASQGLQGSSGEDGAGEGSAGGSLLYDGLVRGEELPLVNLRNDLQTPATRLYPWISENLVLVKRFSPLVAMVSGSGGTVFGLFRAAEEARDAALRLAGRGAVAVPMLSREESRLVPRPKEEV